MIFFPRTKTGQHHAQFAVSPAFGGASIGVNTPPGNTVLTLSPCAKGSRDE